MLKRAREALGKPAKGRCMTARASRTRGDPFPAGYNEPKKDPLTMSQPSIGPDSEVRRVMTTNPTK